MATKKKVQKKAASSAAEASPAEEAMQVSDIVVAQKGNAIDILTSGKWDEMFLHVSAALTTLTPETAGPVFSVVKKMERLVEDYNKLARGYVLALVLSKGEVATDHGTRRFVSGKYELEVQPTGGGLDAGKVEALLRSKGVQPIDGMDPTITYKVNPGKLDQLVLKKKLTNDELSNCKSEAGWKVMSPKHVKEE